MHRIAAFAPTLLLILVGWGSPSLPAQVPAPIAEKELPFKQPGLLELAKLYQEFDLPLPPKSAFFAITDEGAPAIFAPADKTDILYQLRFAVGGPYPKAKYRVWAGFEVHEEETLAVIFPKPPNPETVMPFLRLNRLRGEYEPGYSHYAELVFAIQCQLLEHFELAKFFYRRCIKSDSRPMDQNLVLIAWNYWGSEIGKSRREMSVVAKKLRHLIDKHRLLELVGQQPPRAEEKIGSDFQDHQALLTRVELTLSTKPSKPGSIEALIDKLLLDRTAGNGQEIPLPEEDGEAEQGRLAEGEKQKLAPNKKKPDPQAELRNLGFAAVPTLIDHVDDERLIRHHPLGLESDRLTIVNSRSYRTVGSIVRQILLTFFDLNEHEATKEDYLKSWNEIKSLKESDFVAKRLQSKSDLPWHFLGFAKDKHINKFVDAYPTLVQQSTDSIRVHYLVNMVYHSKLSVKDKIELLTPSARDRSMLQRSNALHSLLELDNEVFSKLCKETMDKYTKDGFSDEEEIYCLNIIALGFHSKDPGTQEVAEKLTLKLPLRRKLEIIKQISRGIFDEPTGRKARSLVLPFLDDKDIYQLDRKSWFHLDHSISEIEIRNLMAVELLGNMDIRIPVNDKTTDETWDKIRALAKEEIERRLENKGKR